METRESCSVAIIQHFNDVVTCDCLAWKVLILREGFVISLWNLFKCFKKSKECRSPGHSSDSPEE